MPASAPSLGGGVDKVPSRTINIFSAVPLADAALTIEQHGLVRAGLCRFYAGEYAIEIVERFYAWIKPVWGQAAGGRHDQLRAALAHIAAD